MAENVVSKLTSYKWLREAMMGRVLTFINSVNFKPETITRTVAGERHVFHLGSPTGKTWYGSATDDAIEMRFVKDMLIKPGDVVVECGGHHGAGSILLSRWVGETGRVVVIEPMQANLVILKKNLALNGIANVTLIEKAAGSECGLVDMKVDSNSAVLPGSGGNTVQVEAVTVDSVAESLGITPTLLKIDVEGFEYNLLEGCARVLASRPAIFLEVHTLTLPRYGYVFADLWKFINPHDYDIFIQREDVDEPSPYSLDEVPGGRVHLFFRPLAVAAEAGALAGIAAGSA